MQSFSGVLLDFDGTLIESEHLHEQADALLFTECGIRLADADWPTFKGRTSADVFAAVHAHYGSTLTVPEMIARKQVLLLEMLHEIVLLPGAARVLEMLRARGVPHALVTSTDRVLVDAIIARLGLSFDAVITADDVTRPKPDADPYVRGARALGLDPATCLVVEDALHGVRSGKNAGCYVVAVTTSFERDLLEAAGADAVVPGVEALCEAPYAEAMQPRASEKTG